MDLEEQTADERRIRACGWHELCMYFLLCFVSPSQLDADAETLRGVLCVLWDHVAAFRNGTTWKTNMHLDNHWLVEENNLRGGPLSGSKSTLSFRSLDFLLLHLYRPHTHTHCLGSLAGIILASPCVSGHLVHPLRLEPCLHRRT